MIGRLAHSFKDRLISCRSFCNAYASAARSRSSLTFGEEGITFRIGYLLNRKVHASTGPSAVAIGGIRRSVNATATRPTGTKSVENEPSLEIRAVRRLPFVPSVGMNSTHPDVTGRPPTVIVP